MGILPETSRLRTSVSLVIILLIGICFLGFTTWTHLNRSQSYQRKIDFLERTLSKMSKIESEADGREADFQRELRKHKQGMQHMNAVAHQEIMRLKYQCAEEKDQFTQTIEANNAVIKEKEDLISKMKQAYLTMQQDMAGFQKNQSQLLEKFTLQAESMEMLVRLKDKCYSQMNSISQRISVPSLPSAGAAAGRSAKTQDKGSREEQPEGKREAVNSNADPPTTILAKTPTPPSAIRIPIQPLRILDQLKGLFTDTGSKEHRSGVKADVNVTSPPAAKPSASPSLSKVLIPRPQPANKPKNVSRDRVKGRDTNGDKEEEKKKKQEAMDEEVNGAVERKQLTHPLNDEPDVLKPNDKEEEKKKKQEPMDEEVNGAVERKQQTQPLNDEPDVLKPNDKEKKKERESMDEEVNRALGEKEIDQPPTDEPDIVKPNEKLEAKKEEELKDPNAKAAGKEKQPAQPLEDELDLHQPNRKEEAKNEEEPF